MPNYSQNDVVLVQYPFSDVSVKKVRPAVVVNVPHVSQDMLVVPLTSKTTSLLTGEFVITDWTLAGLNVVTAVKRGIYTVHQSLIVKKLGKLSNADSQKMEMALKEWLGMS